jgi:hypothetical protein
LFLLVRPAGFEPATYGSEFIFSFCEPVIVSITEEVFIQTVNFYSIFKQLEFLEVPECSFVGKVVGYDHLLTDQEEWKLAIFLKWL